MSTPEPISPSEATRPPGRKVFINLMVRDQARARAFFAALGFAIDPMFTDETAACVVIEPGAVYAMLLSPQFFQNFTRRQICDTTTHSEALIALSCESRAAVDALVAGALAAGGSETGVPVQDHGFMYGASFYDPDGHHWEVFWMADMPPEGLSPEGAEGAEPQTPHSENEGEIS